MVSVVNVLVNLIEMNICIAFFKKYTELDAFSNVSLKYYIIPTLLPHDNDIVIIIIIIIIIIERQ